MSPRNVFTVDHHQGFIYESSLGGRSAKKNCEWYTCLMQSNQVLVYISRLSISLSTYKFSLYTGKLKEVSPATPPPDETQIMHGVQFQIHITMQLSAAITGDGTIPISVHNSLSSPNSPIKILGLNVQTQVACPIHLWLAIIACLA